jgi:methyl-accepting chemotaxis protein
MLTGIVESVRRMDEIVAKIAEASIEQSRGIQQVTAGVSEMDKVTQGNAATAEESAGAAQELSSQASELQSMVQNLRHLVGVAAETSNASRPVAMHHQPLQAMRSAPRRSAPARRPVAAASSTEFFS